MLKNCCSMIINRLTYPIVIKLSALYNTCMHAASISLWIMAIVYICSPNSVISVSPSMWNGHIGNHTHRHMHKHNTSICHPDIISAKLNVNKRFSTGFLIHSNNKKWMNEQTNRMERKEKSKMRSWKTVSQHLHMWFSLFTYSKRVPYQFFSSHPFIATRWLFYRSHNIIFSASKVNEI